MVATAQNLYQRHPISVADYHRMGEHNFFEPEARVELIEGEIIDMAPIECQHGGLVNRLTRMLVRAVGDNAIVAVQNSITLGDLSEPQPDFALLRPKANDYTDRLPHAEDLLLLIEVCDSSLRYDRTIKAPLYARFGVPEVWLIDVQGEAIIQCHTPLDGRYAVETKLLSPQILSPVALPDVQLDVAKLFE